jgi:hypothetical protein
MLSYPYVFARYPGKDPLLSGEIFASWKRASHYRRSAPQRDGETREKLPE